jgi:hypothetical protein
MLNAGLGNRTMTKSERDKQRFARIKADPVSYAAYLARKRREAAARVKTPAFRQRERERKIVWRTNNPEAVQRIRAAGHAVEAAIELGELTRPAVCGDCGTDKRKIEAHHHKGYQREHWLDVVWALPGMPQESRPRRL